MKFIFILTYALLQSASNLFLNLEAAAQTNPLQKLYIALEHGPRFETFRKQQLLEKIDYIDESMSMKNGTISYEKLTQTIKKKYPNTTSKGICFFDYETPYIDPLFFEDVKSPKFKKAISLYIDVIKFAKKMRPNVKWAHYGIPFGSWDDKNFISQNYRLAELLSVVDILMPSIYMSFDDEEVPFSRNYQYLSDNLTVALDLGIKFGKPVLPFVLHRFYFYKPNPRLQHSEMKDAFWRNYIQSILSISVKNTYVDGVIWWGADKYYYEVEQAKNVRKNFNGTSQEFVNYNDVMLIRKAKIVLDILKNKK